MKPKKIVADLKDIAVRFEGQTILEDINLIIHSNDFLGIIGPNGGGKTTLLKVILGLIKPQRGRLRILGVTPKKARRNIGYVPQVSLFDRNFPISVWEVVLLGRLGKGGLCRTFNENDRKVTEDALKQVNMYDDRHLQIGRLSEGQKQRVFIARALTKNPQLLLLDEPTASIDKPMQEGLYELLQRLQKEMTIVLVSHDIGAVSTLVNKIACLNRTLFYHDSKEITAQHLESVYHCPVDLIAHGVPHRVLKEHDD